MHSARGAREGFSLEHLHEAMCVAHCVQYRLFHPVLCSVPFNELRTFGLPRAILISVGIIVLVRRIRLDLF